MNAKQVEQMFAAMDKSAELGGGYDMDREWEETNGYEPAPVVAVPAAVPYDLDAPDSELHDMPITSPAMALDFLGVGKTLIAQCGPLQVQATLMYVNEIQVTMWSTVTCTDTCMVIEESEVDTRLTVFGSLTDGSWKVYCPDDPDGAPQY